MGIWDDASSYDSHPKDNNHNKTETFFNRPDQPESVHGHVVESQTSSGQTQYHYARDNAGNEGNVYIDDNLNSTTYTGHQTEPPAPRR